MPLTMDDLDAVRREVWTNDLLRTFLPHGQLYTDGFWDHDRGDWIIAVKALFSDGGPSFMGIERIPSAKVDRWIHNRYTFAEQLDRAVMRAVQSCWWAQAHHRGGYC
jgi:hypothetical protein